MVVCVSGADLESQLSAQWEFMLGMSLYDAFGEDKTAVLIWSCQQSDTALMDLPSQHSAVLSAFADRHRHYTAKLKLRGPLVSSRVVQTLMQHWWPTVQSLHLYASPQLEAESMSCFRSSLPNLTTIEIRHCSIAALELLKLGTRCHQLRTITLAHNQLDADSISIIPRASWAHLRYLDLGHNMIGGAGVQHLVSYSWPSLQILFLTNTGIDGAALRCLAQGQWPELCLLDLLDNNIDATGALYLTQGNWPLLTILVLSFQGLDQEACSLLGIAYPDRRIIQMNQMVPCKSRLHQFPNLKVHMYA